jgi:sigma-E factor negative regulatory protein RseC
MSEELATVVAIDGNHAWVECERRSACSGCHQQSNCGTGTVAKAFPMKAQRLRVALTIEVSGRPADPPRHPQASILRGAALVYVLPLFCLLLGALLGQLWLVPLLSAGEGVTILSCLLGGAIGFLLVRYFSDRLEQGNMVPACSGWCSIPVTLATSGGHPGAQRPPDKALFLGPAD